jgi:hypothetical protein
MDKKDFFWDRFFCGNILSYSSRKSSGDDLRASFTEDIAWKFLCPLHNGTFHDRDDFFDHEHISLLETS